MSIPSEFKTKVVGLTWISGYPENIYKLNEIAEQRVLTTPGQDGTPTTEPLPALLIRNPENPADVNTIEVHVPSLGDDAWIGHVPAKVAERLSPCLDAGEIWQCDIFMVAIHPDFPENPGIHLHIWKVEDDEPF